MDNTGGGSRHVGNDDEFNLGHVERIQVEVSGGAIGEKSGLGRETWESTMLRGELWLGS